MTKFKKQVAAEGLLRRKSLTVLNCPEDADAAWMCASLRLVDTAAKAMAGDLEKR